MFENQKIEQKVTFLTSDTEMATNGFVKNNSSHLFYHGPFRFVIGLTLKVSIAYITSISKDSGN